MAGADDGGRFAVDEDPERVPIAGQDSLDSGAFIECPWSGRRQLSVLAVA